MEEDTVEDFPGTEEFPDDPDAPKKRDKKKKKKSGGFQSMDLNSQVLKGILTKGYQVPTPIQRKVIPVINQGQDVVAMARTGSGKTAAFVIPMLQRLKSHSAKVGVRAVILSPTRELALQTMKFTADLGRFTDLRACVIVGGDSMDEQFSGLARNPDIIIATPGRFLHHLVEVDLSLNLVEYLVFDEADRLFEMGFSQQLEQIIHRVSSNRQTILMSATMPRILVDFAKAGLQNPRLMRLDTESQISDNLKLAFLVCRPEEKLGALLHLLGTHIQAGKLTIVFVATRHQVEYIQDILKAAGVRSCGIFGNMDQTARKASLNSFRKGYPSVLLVTDVAARGIDIPLLDNVINYDFPGKPKLFIHRVGRAARAGRTGTAYSLVAPEEVPYMIDLHLFLGKKLSPNDPKHAYGRVPQSILDHSSDQVAHIISHNGDLQNVQRVVTNAYKLYYRTRPDASSESAQRAKELPQPIGIHPVFEGEMNPQEEERFDLVNSLKTFRPQQTIMEMQHRNRLVPATTRTTVTAPAAGLNAVEIMKQKNYIHGGLIVKHREKVSLRNQQRSDSGIQFDDPSSLPSAGTKRERPDDDVDDDVAPSPAKKKQKVTKPKAKANATKKPKPASFRDEEFFMDHSKPELSRERGLSIREDFTRSTQDIVMDLIPDEGEHLHKKQQTMKWDRKKKKMVGPSSTTSAIFGTVSKPKKVVNESGGRVDPKNRKNFYEDWQRRSKQSIQRTGEEENAAASSAPSLAQMRRKTFRHQTSSDGPKVRDEVKNPEQIAKARKEKAQKQKLQNKSARKTPNHHPKKTRRLDAKSSQFRTRSRVVIH